MFSSFSSFLFIIIEFSVCPSRLFTSVLKSGLVNPGLSLNTLVEISFYITKSGFWSLVSGFWSLVPGFWSLDSSLWSLVSGLWPLISCL